MKATLSQLLTCWGKYPAVNTFNCVHIVNSIHFVHYCFSLKHVQGGKSVGGDEGAEVEEERWRKEWVACSMNYRMMQIVKK